MESTTSTSTCNRDQDDYKEFDRGQVLHPPSTPLTSHESFSSDRKVAASTPSISTSNITEKKHSVVVLATEKQKPKIATL